MEQHAAHVHEQDSIATQAGGVDDVDNSTHMHSQHTASTQDALARNAQRRTRREEHASTVQYRTVQHSSHAPRLAVQGTVVGGKQRAQQPHAKRPVSCLEVLRTALAHHVLQHPAKACARFQHESNTAHFRNIATTPQGRVCDDDKQHSNRAQASMRLRRTEPGALMVAHALLVFTYVLLCLFSACRHWAALL